MRDRILAAICGLALAQAIAPANATVLTFDGNICSGSPCADYQLIDQSYGDDATIDVQYDNNVSDSNLLGSLNARMGFWGSSFTILNNVAHGTSSYSAAEIFLAPSSGYEVQLTSLDLGGWSCITRSSQLTVTGTSIASASADTCGTGGHLHYTFAGYSSTGIGIEFGPDAYDLGIDNITFDVRALNLGSSEGIESVPEPSTLAMFGSALLAIAGRRRRKQKA